jgi:tRNA nucleotidyltransferase/poly(A) polymerase
MQELMTHMDEVTEARMRFPMVLPESIRKIHRLFMESDFKLFVVGGAVRDAFLGLTPKDFDLATDALPDVVEQLMAGAGIRTLATGKSFGVINVFIDEDEFEIATFRIDQYNSDDLEGFKNYLKGLNNGTYEKFIAELMK